MAFVIGSDLEIVEPTYRAYRRYYLPFRSVLTFVDM
jgi:hypothetical protein